MLCMRNKEISLILLLHSRVSMHFDIDVPNSVLALLYVPENVLGKLKTAITKLIVRDIRTVLDARSHSGCPRAVQYYVSLIHRYLLNVRMGKDRSGATDF